MHRLKRSGTPCFTPDSTKLITSSSNGVLRFDVVTGAFEHQFEAVSHLSKASISPDGSRIAVKSTSGRILVFDLEGTCLLDCKNQREGEGCNLVWTEDGQFLIDGSWKGAIRQRNAETGEIVMEIASHHVGYLELLPQGRLATIQTIVGDHARSFLAVRNASDLTPSYQVFFDGYRHTEGISPLGRFVWSVRPGEVFELADSELHLIATWASDGAGSGYAVAFHPDFREMTCVIRRWQITRLRIPSLEEIQSYEVEYPCEAAYSPDGQWLALGGWKSGKLVRLD
ncbi:MAG: hypothetical protein K1X67_03035 [Fimbriimonadaceae bacterium]|nr:hypothetical protein [Fimbriimonadaceae bacterium]